MNCESCGFQNRAGILFCEECGARLGTKSCPDCGFENRPDVSFCEECGYAFAPEVETAKPMIETKSCPDCGFENRPDVSFCEECGYAFAPVIEAVESVIETKSCPDCGLENRPDVSFCEECGYAFTPVIEVPEAVIETKSCPDCGYDNRPEVSFCEECGYSFVEEPVVVEMQAQRKTVRVRRKPDGKRRRVWTFAGVAGVAVLAVVISLAWPYFRQPVNDFTPIQEELENAAVTTAVESAQQYADWVVPDSAELEMIDTEAGQAFMITFDSEPVNAEGSFSPQLIIIIDPITGETTYMEAP